MTYSGLAATYPFRKVWREGLEVAIKIKGSQGQRRVVWLNVDHPFIALSPVFEVHANHNEANNAALRRHCSAYRRRQNLYAKTTEGLQRSMDVQLHVQDEHAIQNHFFCALRAFSKLEILCIKGVVKNCYEISRQLFVSVIRQFILNNLTEATFSLLCRGEFVNS